MTYIEGKLVPKNKGVSIVASRFNNSLPPGFCPAPGLSAAFHVRFSEDIIYVAWVPGTILQNTAHRLHVAANRTTMSINHVPGHMIRGRHQPLRPCVLRQINLRALPRPLPCQKSVMGGNC